MGCRLKCCAARHANDGSRTLTILRLTIGRCAGASIATNIHLSHPMIALETEFWMRLKVNSLFCDALQDEWWRLDCPSIVDGEFLPPITTNEL